MIMRKISMGRRAAKLVFAATIGASGFYAWTLNAASLEEQQQAAGAIVTKAKELAKTVQAERPISPFRAIRFSGAAEGEIVQDPLAESMLLPNTRYLATGNCVGEGSGTYGICLALEGVAGLGHSHSNRQPPVEFPNNDRCKSGIPLNTEVSWLFKTPEYAAQLKATWTWTGACQGSQSETANVGIEGLAELGPGAGYDLVGKTPTHPRNHFGTSEALTQLPLIAAQYKREFPRNPNLNYNDMSLPFGGLFDWKDTWAPPHKTHRFGYQIDINLSSVPVADRTRLQEIFVANQARWIIEGEPLHYHLDFTPKESPLYEEELVCD